MYDDQTLPLFEHKLKPKIVCIGGGTGTFTVLRGLRQFSNSLAAVVGMADDGGSNRRLRDEFGMLPTSDIRQCLVALAKVDGDERDNLLRKLFMYRFSKGDGTAGHTFGNLFLAALTDILGSEIKAIEAAGKVLNVVGEVTPVTIDDSRLVAEYEDGTIVRGEHNIDEPEHDGKLRIVKLSLDPASTVYSRAKTLIETADLIVLGPGDLYTSILQNLVVAGVSDAIAHSTAKVVYILNLMTKFGQTYQYSAMEHLKELEKYLGAGVLDAVFVNQGKLPESVLLQYKQNNEFPVQDNLEDRWSKAEIIRGDFVDPVNVRKVQGDALNRSLIRHNSVKIARALTTYLSTRRSNDVPLSRDL